MLACARELYSGKIVGSSKVCFRRKCTFRAQKRMGASSLQPKNRLQRMQRVKSEKFLLNMLRERRRDVLLVFRCVLVLEMDSALASARSAGC